MTLYTPDDIADAQRDLDTLHAIRAAETDPRQVAAMAEEIALSEMYLAEMIEAVFPRLPFPMERQSMQWRLYP